MAGMTITCPWCGTSYTAFQNNCRNCGAPLPPPAELEKLTARKSGRLQMPPAPPREIADSYIWRLMGQDGWVISSAVFVLLGVIFGFVGGGLTIGIITAFVGIPFLGMGLLFLGGGLAIIYWRYHEATNILNVLKHGQAKEGEITGLEPNYNVRINGRTPWTVYYRFSVDGKDYDGKVSTLNDPSFFMQPGSPAVVLYLPDAPEHNGLYPHP
jgi:hypothetical protein